MNRLVADASFCGAWILEDEASAFAESILQSLEDSVAELVVPSLWQYEMLNLLKMAVRRRRLTQTVANDALKTLQRVPISELDVPDSHAMENILKLAFEHDLTAYDATYLELAVRLKLPLYSLDTALKSAAESCGLETSCQKLFSSQS
ncbi:MAG: type II toxin-antitoxin system VapC family toxin [Opitutales bacterium]